MKIPHDFNVGQQHFCNDEIFVKPTAEAALNGLKGDTK